MFRIVHPIMLMCWICLQSFAAGPLGKVEHLGGWIQQSDPGQMDMTKTGTFNDVNGNGVADAGEIVSYNFLLTNSGNFLLTNVTVTDNLINLPETFIELAIGESDNSTFYGDYEITQDDVDAGQVDNTATADSNESKPVTSLEVTQLIQEPSLNLTGNATFNDENGDGKADLGETIGYKFILENTGNITLSGVVVSDEKITITGNEIILDVGEINNSAFTGSYAITQEDINTGEFINGTLVNSNQFGPAFWSTTVSLVQVPELGLTKSGTFNDLNNNGLADSGETITYQFVVENLGNVDLNNVIVSDPEAQVTGGPVDLSVNETDNSTFMASYEIVQDDVNSGQISNTATADSDEVGPVNASATVLLAKQARMRLLKTGVFNDENGDGNADAGETISYTFQVENTGNVTLTGVTVSDPMISISGSPVTLEVREINNSTFSGDYIITQDDINAGNVQNSATADSDQTEPVTDDETTILVQEPGLSIVKTGTFNDADGDGNADVGETISYGFLVENTGNIVLNGVTVVDNITTVNGGPVDLDPGESDNTTFTASYSISQEDIDAGFVENTASANANGIDPVNDTETTPLAQDAQLQFAISGTFDDDNLNGIADAGETIIYTFLFENTGNVRLTNVTVSDFPVAVTGESIDLSPGESVNDAFSAEYTIDQDDIDAGVVAYSGEADSDQTPSVPASVSTELAQEASLQLAKSGTWNDGNNDGKTDVGETIDYTFTVENTGNITLTDVTITDPLIPVSGGPITLAPGESDNVSFSGSYIITEQDVINGEVVNTAQAESAEAGPATAGATTNLVQEAGLVFTKSGIFIDENQDGNADIGETISYSFVLENTGNIPLTDITVSDSLVDVQGLLLLLSPGTTNSTAFSASYEITQDDINNGQVRNVATASSLLTEPVTSIEITSLGQDARIASIKTGSFEDLNNNNQADPGETVNYEYTVENIGNVILYDIFLTENTSNFSGTGTLPSPVVESGGTNAGGNENAPDLPAGEQITFASSYTITQADIDAGSITNQAEVQAQDPIGNTIVTLSDNNNNLENDPTVVLLPQQPDITLQKSTDASGFSVLDEEIVYTIRIENTGNTTLSDIQLTDAITGMNANVDVLSPGESEEYLSVYQVRQVDINAGSISNTVVATYIFAGNQYEERATAVINAFSYPVAENDMETGVQPGDNAQVDILANDRLGNGADANPANVTIRLINPATGEPSQEPYRYVASGEGEWTYDSTSGILTFSPDVGFTTDPSEVEYLLIENTTQLSSEAVVNIDYNEQPPQALDDNSSSNVPGMNVSLNILENDLLSDGNPVSVSLVKVELIDPGSGNPTSDTQVEIAGEGLWTYTPETGQITFDPQIGFTTDPAPLDYRLTEVLTDLSDEASITVDYIGIDPVAQNDNLSDIEPGVTAVISILDNDQLSDGSTAGAGNSEIELIDPETGNPAADAHVLDVEGEGFWQYNPDTGELSFNPDAGFTIDPTPVNYRLTELLTGFSDEAVVTVDYILLSPQAEDDLSEDNQPGSSVLVSILDNDLLSDQSQATTENTTIELIDPDTGNPASNVNRVVADGEGEWIYNPSSGTLRFNPQFGFVGDPSPIEYFLTELLTGLNDDATVSITYTLLESIAINDISPGHIPGNNAVVDILENDRLSDGSQATVNNTEVKLVDPSTGSPVASNTIIVDDEGSWLYNEAIGIITFNPDAGFTTDPEPLQYELTENGTGITGTAEIQVNYSERPPYAVNDTGYVGSPGTVASVNIIGNDLLSDSTMADEDHVSISLVDPSDGQPAGNVVLVEGEGQWRYDAVAGILVFEPDESLSGNPSPLEYVLTEDITDLTDRAAVIIEYQVSAGELQATNDSITLSSAGITALIDILENDILSDGSSASETRVTIALLDPETGSPGFNPFYLNVAGEGEWTYSPLTGILEFEPDDGIDSNPAPLVYRLTEIRTGLSDEATVYVNIRGLNLAPVAENDLYTVGDCRSADLDVLQNDSDPDPGDQLGVPEIISQPVSGEVEVNAGGTIEYIPERGFEGLVNFSYRICDPNDVELCDEATVTVRVVADTDCDSIPNRDDLDDDNDGIPDVDEGTASADFDDDEVPDYLDIDSDNDGITDNMEWQPEGEYVFPSGLDLNLNGWDDAYDQSAEGVYDEPVDTDDDGSPDYLDLDSDDDNVPDSNEGFDANFDAVADVTATGIDFDNDGLDDAYDVITGWSDPDNPLGSNQILADFDDDGIRDWRDEDDDDDGRPTTGIDDKYSGVDCELFIPEIFSPNNDGVQDYFRIVCIEKYPQSQIEIFNRWGMLVYEQNHYGNTDRWSTTDAWWNGHSNKNGNEGDLLPAGTYFYILDLNNGSEPVNGFIYLNR